MGLDTCERSVMCVGELIIDYLFESDRFPQKNETILINPFPGRGELGGTALNVAWYLSQLETSTKISLHYGSEQNDLIGKICRNAGIVNILPPYEGGSDVLFSVIINEAHRSYALLGEDNFSPIQDIETILDDSDLLLLCGSRHSILRSKYASLSNGSESQSVYFCPSYCVYEYERNDLESIIMMSDYLFCNYDEVDHIIKKLSLGDPKDLLSKFDIIPVITKGKDGVVAYTYTDFISVKSVPVLVANQFGGGDAFVAGFVSSIIKGNGILESMKKGVQVAAAAGGSDFVRVKIER